MDHFHGRLCKPQPQMRGCFRALWIRGFQPRPGAGGNIIFTEANSFMKRLLFSCQEAVISDLGKFSRELFGLFLIFIAALLCLSLFSFSATDPSFNYVQSGSPEAANLAGLLGAYIAGFLNDIMGAGALVWPAVFAFFGLSFLSAKYIMRWWRWCGLFLLTVCALVFFSAFDFSIGDLSGGGIAGGALYKDGLRYLSPFGTFIIWLFLFLIGIQLVFNFSWPSALAMACAWLSAKFFSPEMKRRAQALKEKLGPASLYWPKKFPDFAEKIKLPSLEPLKSFFKRLKKPALLNNKNNDAFGARPEESAPARSFPDIKILPAAPGEKSSYESAPAFTRLSGKSAVDEAYDAPWGGSPAAAEPDIERGRAAGHYLEPQEARGPEHASTSHYEPREEPERPSWTPSYVEPQEGNEREPEVEGSEAMQSPPGGVQLFHEESVIHPLPPTDLLLPAPPPPPASMERLKKRGQDLMACFNDFGIQGELVKITPGPVITMFEVRPAAGVRVAKISNLAEDISLALKALSVRIQPVPGSNTVGIEIPNDEREMVNFRELAESPDFRESAGSLPIILGKTISGQPFSADLSKMPHLLVGGTTGAGKSVSLNAMLISLLYKLQPSELKLLLIDPKRVEMAVYADIPHLVHPVVTEMDDAKSALEWAIHEMERRLDTIKRLGARNVASYNQRLASLKGTLPPEFSDLQPIPYLVIVIDELADLMMTAAREVESCIQRLLQLARAAAIHLILATQRPSVDVVTGLLKANLNCRVAFKVISRPDSRTILDQTGAEQLLGKGDMLYKPPSGALMRLHAPYLSDEEIQAVVNYWKEKENPVYDIDFSKWSQDCGSPSSQGGDFSDNLYEEAKAFVIDQGRCSISLLQRHLKIGFNRSARIIEQMEKDGIISAADGSKPRAVIRN